MVVDPTFDGQTDVVDVLHDLAVGETQSGITIDGQVCVAPEVGVRVFDLVAKTVNLNDEFELLAHEIGNVGFDGALPEKAVTAHLFGPQDLAPEFDFGRRGVVTQLASERFEFFVVMVVAWHLCGLFRQC